MDAFAFGAVLLFPIIVVLGSRLPIPRRAAIPVLILCSGVLVFAMLGYQIRNKSVEFLGIYCSLLFSCICITRLMRLPGWVNYTVAFTISSFLLLTSLAWIWGLNDYFGERTLINDEHPRYHLYGQDTGNFSDYQVLFEVRTLHFGGCVYRVKGSKLVQEQSVREITTSVAADDHFEIRFDRGSTVQIDIGVPFEQSEE